MAFNQTSVLEMTVFGRSNTGQQVLNVLHYRQVNTIPTAYAITELEAMNLQFAAEWRADILPLLSDGYKVEKYRARALTGVIANPTPPPATIITVGDQHEIAAPATDVGSRPGIQEVTFAAVGVQKLVDRAGRNFRGGIRLGTITDDDQIVNVLDTPYKTLVDTQFTNLRTSVINAGLGFPDWVMCVFSRTLALAAPPPFTDMRADTAGVIGHVVNGFVTSQVSRKQSLTQPT